MHHRRLTLMMMSAAWLAAHGGAARGAEGPTPTSPPPPSPPSPPSPRPPGWKALSDMPQALAKFGAAVVGTQVVTAGGYDTLRTVQLLDTVTGIWSGGPPLIRGTDNVAVLAVRGRVHAIGGEARTAHQVYDPLTGLWTSGPPSPRIRFASAAAVLNGRLHLMGGWNYNNNASDSLDSHDIYDPKTGLWTAAAPLAIKRNAAAAAALDGHIVVIGGRAPGIRANDQASLASCEVYDPVADRWSEGPALPQARASLAAVTLGGSVYALGGESTPGGVLASVTRLDALSGSWATLPDMPLAAPGLAAVVVRRGIVVMGGFTGPSDAVGTESRACWRYKPKA
jgi:hypothetical protein